MKSQAIIVVLIIIIIICIILYVGIYNYILIGTSPTISCTSNTSNNFRSMNNKFKRIYPNKSYDLNNLNKKQKRKQNKTNFAVDCYRDDICNNQENGAGCRTIFYTDGICLDNNCIPTDDYDEYRDAIIDGNWQGVNDIKKYAKLYQDYEKTFVPSLCGQYTDS